MIIIKISVINLISSYRNISYEPYLKGYELSVMNLILKDQQLIINLIFSRDEQLKE